MTYRLDEKLYIDVNGDRQHIHIRSNVPDDEVLLFVHGGPGVCDRSWVMPKQSEYLADHCVMVCWDQRMAGKNYRNRNKDKDITISEMVEDMHDVVLYLKKRFGKEKIAFVGHSWGSILGVCYLQKYPETISAYVGMGQFINGPLNEKMSYDFVVNYAKEHDDKKALKDLLGIGEPVNGLYAGGLDALMVQRNYMTKFGGGSYKEKENIFKSVLVPVLSSGEYNYFTHLYRYYMGTFLCLKKLWPQVVSLEFDKNVKKLDVPVYLFQGDHDQNTPTVLAKAWFDELEAPYKEYVPFHESAHSPIKEEAELWGKTLVEKLYK
ncbi:MAG: alpha/beta hydrolase [Clostridia bacterium]|nr:alpha/beta hydrolase [Clostridia bacterium]